MGDEPGWDDYAATWDDDPSVRLYADRVFESVERYVAPLLPRPLERCRVLDFGCGTGQLSERLGPRCAAVVAVDVSSKMVEVLGGKIARAPALANVTPVVANLEAQSAGDIEALAEPFDAILASSVCAFLDSYPETLSTLAGLLVPGGVFAQWDWFAADADAEFGLRRETIEAALATAGLEARELVAPVFSLESKKGPQPVILGVGQRRSS